MQLVRDYAVSCSFPILQLSEIDVYPSTYLSTPNASCWSTSFRCVMVFRVGRKPSVSPRKSPRPGLRSIIAAETAYDITSRSPPHQSFPKFAVGDPFFLSIVTQFNKQLVVLDERVLVLDILRLALASLCRHECFHLLECFPV